MKRAFLTILSLGCLIPAQGNAQNCGQGELLLEFIQIQTFAPTDTHMVRLSGVLDMPSPNYAYTLSVDKSNKERTHGELSFHEKTPGMMSIAVITPITIDETFDIPNTTKVFFLNVTKTFNWGAEYFQAKFPEGFGGKGAFCLKPEMYK